MASVDRILRLYPDDCSGRIERLGAAGGFSGACLWRVHAPRGTLCLRRWPREHPSRGRLNLIHMLLGHVEALGFHRVAVPLPTATGRTFVPLGHHHWELAPWLPGAADYHAHPSQARLEAALAALAEFHAAAASFLAPPRRPVGPLVSVGIAKRFARLRRLRSGDLDELARHVTSEHWPELARRSARYFELFRCAAEKVEHLLRLALDYRVPIQYCLRDVWHDHVLFEGERVTGLVDYEAADLESPAGDVARLLGSLVGDDRQAWQVGLAAYERLRPLSTAERLLMTAFDQSNVLMAGINWFDWVYRRGRRFEGRERITRRIDENLQRLEHLADQ